MFGVTKYPTLIVLPGGTKEPVVFDGLFTKDAMKGFLAQHVSAASDALPKKQKPAAQEKDKEKVENVAKSASDSSTFSEASASHARSEALEDIIDATTVVTSEPTESPDPVAVPKEAPMPVVIQDLPPSIPSVADEKDLQTQCLAEKAPTCILALLPTGAEDEGSLLPDTYAALGSLAEIADKHVKRGRKLFPFYSVPARNSGAAALRDALKLGGDSQLELVAINSRRGWWRKYQGEKYDPKSMEDWVDRIRFGEGEKGKLPDGIVVRMPEQQPSTSEEEPAKPAAPKHEEL
jgi:protein disulfide-isomerase A6